MKHARFTHHVRMKHILNIHEALSEKPQSDWKTTWAQRPTACNDKDDGDNQNDEKNDSDRNDKDINDDNEVDDNDDVDGGDDKDNNNKKWGQ